MDVCGSMAIKVKSSEAGRQEETGKVERMEAGEKYQES